VAPGAALAGLGVVGLSSPLLFFVVGAGVEEAEDLPLRGLVGSFLAWPLVPDPFSLGEPPLIPF